MTMAPKFDPSEILYNPSSYSQERHLETLIVEFAVLGYLDIARRLTSLINTHAPPLNHKRDTHGDSLKPLWLVWEQTGIWPTGEEEFIKDESLKNLMKQYESDIGFNGDPDNHLGTNSVGERIANVYKEDLDGLRKLLQVVERKEDFKPDYAAASTGNYSKEISAIMVKALDLRLRLGSESNIDEGESPSVDDLLDMIAERLHYNSLISYLSKSTRSWKILEQGALAKAVGVLDSKVVELGKEIEEIWTQRYTKGRVIDQRTMEENLSICSENTLQNLKTKEWFGEEPPTTLLQPPGATPEQITELEKKLGVELPEDYKLFLSFSHGYKATWGGVIMDPPLHPADEVTWADDEWYFTDLDLELLNIRSFDLHSARSDHISENDTMVGRTIEIGTEGIDNVWLLPPPI